jgi:hypothetical protein
LNPAGPARRPLSVAHGRLYGAIWRSYMVIGLLVLASVVAIAFDDDVAAAGLLAAAVLVSVGGF